MEEVKIEKLQKEVILIVLMSFIVVLVITTPVYGLMTKEKLNNMLEERGKLIGEPYEPPTPKLEGLPWETKQGLTQSEKLKELQAQNEKQEQFMREWEEKPKEYMTYEEAWLEITNEHFGTNYTSLEEASLGLYEKSLEMLENPSLYYWPP